MKQLCWFQENGKEAPITKIPLKFTFPPVEALSKELTKLNSSWQQRIAYLGPRWENSAIFNKKFSANGGYPFRINEINNQSTLLHDSMTHNQFYRNQIFYRAFEGMNPTLQKEKQLSFQSRFESGNLDCAVKVNEKEFQHKGPHLLVLFFNKKLQKGTKSQIQYLQSNQVEDPLRKIQNLHPFMYTSKTRQWRQQGMTNVTFNPKKLRYQFLYEKMNIRNLYQLSFTVEFNDEEEIRFAYCIPYTYSDLLKDISDLDRKYLEVGTLGQSLTGLNIPLLVFGKYQESKEKPIMLITGRIHPGESNGSLIISNFMKNLSGSPEYRFLREKVLIVMIPMINVDGVILGNSRCSASGKDLNREFKTRIRCLFPEVFLVKNLVDKILDTHDLDLYLDFHGHSRKKNMFLFGPNYNITQPEYYKCRIFPKFLSTATPLFRYYSCSYEIPADKKSTARSVMLNEMCIPFVYTVQTSLGFYHDYSSHKDVVFTQQKWEQIGEFVLNALKEYFQEMQQYNLWIESKKKIKLSFAEEIKQSKNATMSLSYQGQSPSSMPKKIPKELKDVMKKDPKDLKLLRIIEQIKQLELKVRDEKQKNNQKEEDQDSDSHDEVQDLQKEKMYEFTGMVVECIQYEEKRKLNQFEKSYKKKEEKPLKRNKRTRLELKKMRQTRYKEDQACLGLSEDQKNFKKKRVDIQTQNRYRKVIIEPGQQIFENRRKKQILSEQLSKSKIKNNQNSCKKYESHSYRQFLDNQTEFISVQKKNNNNKMNIRMFNFSKMIQNPNTMKNSKEKTKYITPHRHISLNEAKKDKLIDKMKHEEKKDLKIPTHIIDDQTLEYGEEKNISKKFRYQDNNEVKNSQNKNKISFPSSFYRIKYQSHLKKKNQAKKLKALSQQEDYHRIADLSMDHYDHYSPSKFQTSQQQRKRDKLFIKIKKIME